MGFEHIHYLCAAVRREKEDGNWVHTCHSTSSSWLLLSRSDWLQESAEVSHKLLKPDSCWLSRTVLETCTGVAFCTNKCQRIGWSLHPHWGMADTKNQIPISYTRYTLAWLYDLMGFIFYLLYSALSKHNVGKLFPSNSERIYTCCLLTSYGPCGGM